MAQVMTPHFSETQKKFAALIKTTLRKGLKQGGIEDLKISIQPVPRTKLLRVWAVAPKFAELRPSERQDLVWRVLSGSISQDQELQISMIVTLSPEEFAADAE